LVLVGSLAQELGLPLGSEELKVLVALVRTSVQLVSLVVEQQAVQDVLPVRWLEQDHRTSERLRLK
jgi:hypothetical protein